MAKDGSESGSGGNKAKSDKPETEENAAAWDAIPEALREAGRRATDLAQNPYARSLLAAGLVTAAAALAANKNVRDTTRRNLKGATEAAEVAADSASKIGVAIINAATEAVQRMIAVAGAAGATSDAGSKGGSASAKPKPAPKRTTKAPAADGAAAKPSARKPKAANSGNGSTDSKSAKPKPARKPAASGASKSSGKTSGGSAGGGATRKRSPKQDS